MIKIQKLSKISPKGLALLPADRYEYASEIMNPDAILVRSTNMHNMDFPKSLKAVARSGAGTNNIPIESCTKNGIVVFNTPGANANGVKEMVLMSMILASRNVYQSISWAKSLNGKGDHVPKLIEEGKSQFTGAEIKNKKLGVIGLGAVGILVANDATALGMKVMGYDPFLSVDAAWELSRSVKKAISIDTLLSECDYISLHVPLNEETKGLINKEKISIMKENVKLINFARGGLVNNKDLITALKEKKIGCYVTDFPDEDLLDVDGIIPIPHLGASTPESEENCAIMAVSQLMNYLEDGNIVNSVNFPESKLVRSAKYRLTIANKNVPNIIGQITHILAQSSINITDMLNKSKNDYAYTIIDTDQQISDDIISKIEKIDGVILIRVLT